MAHVKILLVFPLLFLITACSVLAQTSGQITGSVTDNTGAAVTDARIDLREVNTGVVHTAQTDARGDYSLLALDTGTYNLKVTHSGFQTFETLSIVIDVNSALRVDAALQVGSTVSSVVVKSDTVSVETVNTQLGDVISGESIEILPLNGRSYTDLLGLQPGVVPVSAGTIDAGAPYGGSSATGNLSINGQREDANGFLINGGSVEEARNNGASIIPNLDSIAEFRVLTSNMDAENGHYSGGLVSVVTKSGANQFHGTLFEFLRNTDLDAKNYFDVNRGVFQQNQFGATIGGPVLHDRLFFFADYQGTRTNQALSTGVVTVPSLAERGGDFSGEAAQLSGTVNGPYFANYLSQRLGYAVINGEPYYVAGCTTGTQCVFPNAVIPPAAFSSAAQGMLQFIPSPNSNGAFVSTANNQQTTDDKGGIRVDFNSHRVGDASVYFFKDGFSQVTPFGNNNVPGFPIQNTQTPWAINVSHVFTFNATTVNEFRFARTRFVAFANQPTRGLGTKLSSLGFTEGGQGGIVPANPAYEGVPSISLNNFSFGQPGVVYQRLESPPQYLDNFSKVLGRHGLKFGMEYVSSDFHQYFPSVGGNGFISFNGSETGIDFADYLLGAPASFIQESTLDYDNVKKYFGLYGEDSWQASPKLTVNYGLRWEYIPNWHEKSDKTSDTFIPGEQSTVFPTAPAGLLYAGDSKPGGGKIQRTVSETPLNNFAPRLGFAFTPDRGKTSLRTAYGIFYTNNEGSQVYSITGAPPFAEFYLASAPPFLDTPYRNRTDGAVHPSPFPFTPAKPGSTNFDFSPFLPLSGFPVWSLYNRTPYTQDYNLTLQRQLTPSMIASIGYVGSQAHALVDAVEANPGNAALCLSLSSSSAVAPGSPTCGPFGENTVYTTTSGQTINSTRGPLGSNFGSDIYFASVGNSNYNSLQTSLRFNTHSLFFLAAYTWSKSIDDASDARDTVLNPYDHRLSRELSAFDVPQSFVMNYNYLLPLPEAHHLGLTSLISGWRLAGITRFVSGLPVVMTEGDDRSLIGETSQQLDTPEYDGSTLQRTDPRKGRPYFSTGGFSLEPLGQLGSARRRFFNGPGINNFDMSLIKSTNFTERLHLEFRAEFFNIFNHAQFQNPSGNINNSVFGVVTSANAPRIGQLALKLNF